MKKVFLVLGVVITFMAATMISGWAQKVIDNETYKANFFVGGGEGATKQPIYLGEIKDAGFMVGGGEGAVKPGIKWPEQK